MTGWRATLGAALVVLTAFGGSVFAESPDRRRLNADGVTALLDVMDALAAGHPGFAEKQSAYAQFEEGERRSALDAARGVNERSGNVGAAIDALLATETYQVYFRRFTNITAEDVEDLLLDLPYRQRRAPGDVGNTLYQLFRQRETIRAALDRLLAEADMQWVYETAQRLAPGWEGALPTMHLIYDSNAGSFAAEGIPFFNVFTGIDLPELAVATDRESLRDAEETMAHELQHVLAEPTLYPESEGEKSWQDRWLDDLTRGTVGEGVANLTSPPTGDIQAAYEDPDVLVALAERFNALLRSLVSGEMSEEEMQAWYRDNYFDVAIGLLREHLAKRYAGAELDAQVDASMRYRPDFEHAFGWWMVSRIWESDPRRETVVTLLEDPFAAYRLYNETLAADQAHLRIEWPDGQ